MVLFQGLLATVNNQMLDITWSLCSHQDKRTSISMQTRAGNIITKPQKIIVFNIQYVEHS